VLELQKRGVGPGARWHKADFHVHLPGSSDYRYSGADAIEKLGRALDQARYGFAVVVKHNDFPTRKDLDDLRAHCSQTTLIPGAEINVFVDTMAGKIGKDYFFHCIVAVDPSSADYGYELQRAKEQLNYSARDAVGFHSNIGDVGKWFRDRPGVLFMPAHLHQGKRPEESRSIDDVYADGAFLKFVGESVFDALEVRDPTTAGFFTGDKRTTEGLAIPGAICVSSSDAHHHDEVTSTNRRTWIRAEATTFGELAAALAFRHRVSITEPSRSYAQVIGLHIVGSFISDVWIRLNEGFNALIGAKGSGKTAVLECLRFVLNAPVPPERREAVDRHLAHVLGAAGYVECLVEEVDGAQSLVTRRWDARDRITVLTPNNTLRAVDAHAEMPFSISVLGWHEIEAVADRPEARIALLDRIGDPTAIRNVYREIEREIEKARDDLPILQRQIKRLDGTLKELWDLERKRSTLEKLEQGELVALQREYEWFVASEQTLDALESDSERRSDELPGMLVSRLSLTEPPPEGLDNIDGTLSAIEVVDEAVRKFQNAEESSAASLQTSLKEITSFVAAARAVLAGAFVQFREQSYTPRVNALDPAEREILAKQIQVLEETKRLPLVERQCDDLLVEVRGLARNLRDSCDRVVELRNEVVRQREQIVAQVNAEVTSVRLKLLRSANQELRTQFQTRYGEEGVGLISYVSGFGGGGSYESLRSLFARLLSVDRDQSRWDIKDTLWNVKLLDLLDVVDNDDVEISLDVGNAGFVTIQNLSSGQRSVAVFPLLLRNTRGPLVIDQPEDNLDNRHIADVIAPELVRGKRGQQYLVTSHNANLVVLSDADLIIHVESDGTHASFPVAGFLSCPESDVRKAVVDVLDGGEEALAARQRKYGVSHASVG
jgi:DNA repair ATPase RecN